MTEPCVCPICGSTRFQTYNGRADAQCASCKSLERARLLWVYLERMDLLRPGLRLLHLAPETPLMLRFASLHGDGYRAADLDVSRYRNRKVEVAELDCCRDLAHMPSESFDLIIHNHLLEHVFCSYRQVLLELNRLLAPGGYQLFSVAFRGRWTRENLGPLSDEERTREFGQPDHCRTFGHEDFPRFLADLFGSEEAHIRPSDHMTREEFRRIGMPPGSYDRLDGHTIFRYRKSPAGAARGT